MDVYKNDNKDIFPILEGSMPTDTKIKLLLSNSRQKLAKKGTIDDQITEVLDK